MATGFPVKANYATGDVLSAANMNDLAGTLNYLDPTAKGDLFPASDASTLTRLAVGANNTVLTADSSTATGLKWAAASGGSTGLTLISTASFTTASSVSLATDSFTSTYDNYKLIINISAFVGTNTYLYGRMRAAGSDNTTSNYTSQFTVFSQTATTITNDHGGAASSAFVRFGYVYSAEPEYLVIDLLNPKATAKTTYTGTIGAPSNEGWINSGRFNATTSFDSFSFYPTAGTITGAYSLYGYNK
jgi:hypothetical protein